MLHGPVDNSDEEDSSEPAAFASADPTVKQMTDGLFARPGEWINMIPGRIVTPSRSRGSL